MNFKSKVIPVIFIPLIVIMSIIPAIYSIKSSQYASTIIYIIVIFSIISTTISIGLSYLVYFILFNFIAQKKLNSNIVIFNFLMTIIFSNELFKIIITYILKINYQFTFWANPLMFLCEYIFYRYMVKKENITKKKSIIFLLTVYLFIIIGTIILNFKTNMQV